MLSFFNVNVWKYPTLNVTLLLTLYKLLTIIRYIKATIISNTQTISGIEGDY